MSDILEQIDNYLNESHFKDNVKDKEAAKRIIKKQHGGKDVMVKNKGKKVWILVGGKKAGIYDPDKKRLTYNKVDEGKKLSKDDDKGLKHWHTDYKKAEQLGNRKMSKEIKSAMEKVLKGYSMTFDDYEKMNEDTINEADGWIAIYNRKQIEIDKSEADGIYQAKQIAIKKLKVPKSKIGLLAIKPAYKD